MQIIRTILGFVPHFGVLWTALGLFVTIILAHYIYRWFYHLTELPWMTEENQRNRDKLIQELRNK